MNKIILTFLIFIVSLSLSAQKLSVSYHFSDSIINPNFYKIFKKETIKDSLSLYSYLKTCVLLAQEKGFLEVSVDSVRFKEQQSDIYIYIGQFYKYIKISYDSRYENILLQVHSKYLSANFIQSNLIESENRKIIRYLENNAYPFAQVKLDSISIEMGAIQAFLDIERGEKTLYDSVKIVGNLKISKSFLYGYLGVKPQGFYNDTKIKNIQKNLNDLPFAHQSQKTNISYRNKKVNVYIPVNSKKNNQFDGVLGILPNDKTTGKTLLTGELNIFLQNMLRSAEELSFKWQKLESSSQKLLSHFKIPYIFNTKLGLSASLDLLKQDSTYLNSTLGAGTQFYFKGQNNVGLHYRSQSSSILSKDTILRRQFKAYHINSTGLSFNYRQLDYIFNPHRGVDISIKTNIGKKELDEKQNGTNSLIQYDALIGLKYFIPIKQKHTIALSNQTAFLMSESLYLNELYRIGGLKSLRGFTESSIYASSYSIVNIEYRFIFEKNSAIFTFFDQAWYEKKIEGESYYYDYPFGFGFGLFFKTKAGIFTISYAMGQQRNENINIKNAKIHFGFINRF